LLEFCGQEVGQSQIEHCIVSQEQKLAGELIKLATVEQRIPTQEDVKDCLRLGYLIIANVNSCILNGESGYSGHFIVIKGYNDVSFVVHDPGLPPMDNAKVPFSLFERAWAYPDANQRNISGIRLLRTGSGQANYPNKQPKD
jgi:hypothetical protein